MLCVKPSVRKTCAENFLCKNHLPIIIAVHLKNQSVKASVRKSFCCVKTVLGKVSACKKSRMYFFGAVCVYFFSAKKIVCKNCSVQRLFCGKGSVCKNAYVPLFMCAKASLYKASVCKNFFV